MRKLVALLVIIACVSSASAQLKKVQDTRVPAIQTDIATLQAYQTSATTRMTANESFLAQNANNILANALRVSVNSDLVIFAMDDGYVDNYEDQTGIDLASGSNFTYDATSDYYSYNDLYVSLSQPLIHVKANDSNATTVVTDSGTVGADGTLSGGNTEDKSVAGKVNSALYFDGVGDRVTLPDNSAFSFTDGAGNDDPFSVSVWVKQGADISSVWVGKFDTGVAEWDVVYSSSTKRLYFFCRIANDTAYISRYVSNPYTTDWVHWVLTYDGSNSDSGISIYSNSIPQSTTALNSGSYVGMSDTVTPVTIGDRNNGASPLTGTLDDVRVYAKELSQDEVTALYNSGSGTEDSSFATGQMELISTNGYNATSAPTESRVLILHEEVSGTPTLNTDIKAWSSSDDGSTWDQVTLSDLGELYNGVDMLAGTNALTGASTNMKYRITTHSSTNQGRFHGASILWK